MDVYASLLSELGIDHSIEIDEPIDLQIHRTLDDIEYRWQCEQSLSCSMVNGFALDHSDEQSYDWRKKHRYLRIPRFKLILLNLLNIKSNIDSSIKERVKTLLESHYPNTTPKKIWNNIRCILKELGIKKLYNQIPDLISYCNGQNPVVGHGVVESILHKFDIMHNEFAEFAAIWNRKYFLNLRFVALILIKEHDVVYPYTVPNLRTARRAVYLNDLIKQFSIYVVTKEITSSDRTCEESGKEDIDVGGT